MMKHILPIALISTLTLLWVRRMLMNDAITTFHFAGSFFILIYLSWLVFEINTARHDVKSYSN